MDLLPEIARRVSIRKYSDEPLSDQQIERILEAGRRAPSAKNRQAWRFIVVQDPDMRKSLEEAAFGQEYIAVAPVTIALCTTNIEYKMPNGQLSYPMDLSFAASFMLLQAEHEGLGACVVTTFREHEIKSLLSIPYSMRVVMLLVVGQPDESPEPPARHPFKRVVSYEHW